MKSDAAEDTPSKKKLKQARLPFKIISETTATGTLDTSVSRKRKLSSDDNKIESKIGRLSKENETEELVVISDDENKDNTSKKDEKFVNPLINIVDNARKKKLQKAKTPKRKTIKKTKSSSVEKPDIEINEDKADLNHGIEKMDVDASKIPIETQPIKLIENDNTAESNVSNCNGTTTGKQSEEIIETINLDEDTNSKTGLEHNSPQNDNNGRNKSINCQKSPESETDVSRKLRSNTSITEGKDKISDLDTSTSSSKLNESASSNLSTPKRSTRSSSVSKNSEKETNIKLTPKQVNYLHS